MEKYARRQGFDPLIPENWYAQPIRKIMLIKVIIIYFFFRFCSLIRLSLLVIVC